MTNRISKIKKRRRKKPQVMFQCGYYHDVTRKLYFVFILLFFFGFRFECVSCTEKQVDTELVQSGGTINDPAEVPHQLELPSSSEDRKDILLEHNEQPVILSDEKTKLSKRLRDDDDFTEGLFDSNFTVDISSTTGNLNDDRSSNGPRRASTTELEDVEYAAESEVSSWNPTKAPASKSTTSLVSTSSEITNVEGHFGEQRQRQPSMSRSTTSRSATSTDEFSTDFEEPSEVLYTVTEKNLDVVISTVDESLIESEVRTESSSSSADDTSASEDDTKASENPRNNTTVEDIRTTSIEVSTYKPLFVNTSFTSEFQRDKSDNRSLQETDLVTSSSIRGFNHSAVELLASSQFEDMFTSTNILQSDQFIASSTVSSSEWTSDDVDGGHLMSSFVSKNLIQPSSRLFTVEQFVTSAIQLQIVVVPSQISYMPLLSSVYSNVDESNADLKSSVQVRLSMSSAISTLFTSNASSAPIESAGDQRGNEVRHESSITTTKHSVVEEDSAVIFGQMEVEPTKAEDKQEEPLPEEVENNDGGVVAVDEHNLPDEDEMPSKVSKPREDDKTEDGSPKEESEPNVVAVVVNETVKVLHSGVVEAVASTVMAADITTSVTIHSSMLFDGTASIMPVLMSSMTLKSVSTTVTDGVTSPAFDFDASSIFNSSSELGRQMEVVNSTATELPTGFVPPIAATKTTSIKDRRTKYNRLPTERTMDDDHDVVTDLGYKPDVVLPTIRVPVAYLSITLKCSWAYFCMKRTEFQKEFARQLKTAIKMNIEQTQVVFFNVNVCKHVVVRARNVSVPTESMNVAASAITVPLYVSDEWGVYSKSLTELLGVLIIRNRHRGKPGSLEPDANVTVPNVVLAVQLHRKEEIMATYAQNNTTNLDGDVGIIAVITISCIAAICLVLLFILLYVLKKRNGLKEKTRRCRPVGDAYSLDSVSSIHSSFRRRKSRASKRSYLNQGFDDPHATTNKLNFAGLANACIDDEALAEEYKQISMQMAKYEELPVGAEVKNRYANIIPFPETRVVLNSKTDESGSDYINANYVRGYRGEQKRYIACQAPLASTVTDFWQMVWENQCKVIVMLTAIEEDGMNKCAPYFSETDTLDCHRLYGDYQVTTKKKDVRESYTVTALQLKNLEKNLMRDVFHFWYTSWPTQHVPIDRNSITELLVETRPYTKSNSGPMVVHCSPGTGRTGTVIAIDICMHEFEFTRTLDIPRCVHRLRQDRGGSVQTSEQYIFIYEVLGEYASRLINHSRRSSVRSTR